MGSSASRTSSRIARHCCAALFVRGLHALLALKSCDCPAWGYLVRIWLLVAAIRDVCLAATGSGCWWLPFVSACTVPGMPMQGLHPLEAFLWGEYCTARVQTH